MNSIDELKQKIQRPAKEKFELSVIIIYSFFLVYSIYNLIVTLQNAEESLKFYEIIISLFLGYLISDFSSGIFHWTLDTWMTSDVPVIGSMIAEFREHHVVPHAMTLKTWIDTNGNNCIGGIVSLIWMNFALRANYFKLSVFCLTLSIGVTLTNQIHKWAHETPKNLSTFVKFLQRSGIILSFSHHHGHHTEHLSHYCITNGWMNYLLEPIGFWRKIEWVIHKLTGAIPRENDNATLNSLSEDEKLKTK